MISDFGSWISGFIRNFCTTLKDFAGSIFFYSIFIFTYSIASAQEVKVNASIDTNNIRIGEQFHMNLSAVVPAGTKLLFPQLPDTLKKLEIVRRSKIDTLLSADGKTNTFQQQITLTSFDSGFYVLEPIAFYFQHAGKPDSDSAFTEAQLISVRTIQVDTTRAIKDIKAPLDVPLTFKEILPYLLGALIVLVITLLILRELKRRKKKVVPVKVKIPSRPAHEIALEALKKTEEEKLWQQGFFKRYHSMVSEIIRTYIEHRFSIQALEYTTDETLEHFRGSLINEEAKEKLKYMLQLADMVKFAKVQPIASENEQALSSAYDFIALTKPVTASDFKETEVAS